MTAGLWNEQAESINFLYSRTMFYLPAKSFDSAIPPNTLTGAIGPEVDTGVSWRTRWVLEFPNTERRYAYNEIVLPFGVGTNESLQLVLYFKGVASDAVRWGFLLYRLPMNGLDGGGVPAQGTSRLAPLVTIPATGANTRQRASVTFPPTGNRSLAWLAGPSAPYATHPGPEDELILRIDRNPGANNDTGTGTAKLLGVLGRLGLAEASQHPRP